jgi:hypothetical protein
MDFVNTISGSLTGHRQNNSAVMSSASLLHDSNGALQHSAASVNDSIVEIFKTTLAEADSYLAAFEQRVRLEEDYVRGLKALIEKSREAVSRLDVRIASQISSLDKQRGELPKARRAWKEMLDNDLRELDSRTHYLETVKQGVIAPFAVYRDAQERIRKRVKEDLKTSIQAYEEMRTSILPRAKKTYEKKCEEVEQYRLQQIAIEEQRLLLSQSGLHNREAHAPSLDGNKSVSPPPSLEVDMQTQRVDPNHARPSSSHSKSGKPQSRSGGSDTSEQASHHLGSPGLSPRIGGEATLSSSEKKGNFFEAIRSREAWDTAKKEGPKKLNALINRMRDGGSGSSDQHHSFAGQDLHGTGGALAISGNNALGRGPGSLKSNQSLQLKNVKAKRDAEEADKAYRKAVFDLETLRMRRQKTITAAKASVLEARRELYLTCQAVWQQAGRSTNWLHNELIATNIDMDGILSGCLTSLDDELKQIEASMPVTEDEPVSYINYYHGECKSLIFGVSLTDYAFSRAQKAPPHLGPPKAEAPIIVQKCIEYIETRALDQPGIYRTSAKHTAIQNLAHALERDEARFAFTAADEDPSTVAGVLKLYLRQLPEPILPMPWEERVRYTHERQDQIQTGFASLKGRIRRLPAINQATLRAIVEHLAKVASRAELNKMTPSNLSIIFGPLLLTQVEHDATSIAAAMEEDRVTEDLILYADTIFDLAHAGAPVLPHLQPTSTATESWNLTEAKSDKASTVNLAKEKEITSGNPAIESGTVDHVNNLHASGGVPMTAEAAYLPPASEPTSQLDEQSTSFVTQTEPSGLTVSAPKQDLIAIDTSGALRAHRSDLSKPEDDEGLRSSQRDEQPEVEDPPIPGTQTPNQLSAIPTPISALSSANASLGHDRG